MIDLLVGAAVELATVADDRNDALHRPSRGSYTRVAVDASRVPDRWLAFAKCVERRESNGIPTAKNPSGAAGLFQFMPAWRRGLPYMVRDRLVHYGMPKKDAAEIRRDLTYTPIEKWHPIWQRIGFAEVIDRGGDEHWSLPGSACEKYR